MEVDTFRFLFSALIQSLATVMGLSVVALLAFPRSKTGIKDTKLYNKSMLFVQILVGTCTISLFLNILALVYTDNLNLVFAYLAIGSFFIAMIWLSWFLISYINLIKKV